MININSQYDFNIRVYKFGVSLKERSQRMFQVITYSIRRLLLIF